MWPGRLWFLSASGGVAGEMETDRQFRGVSQGLRAIPGVVCVRQSLTLEPELAGKR